MDEERLKTARAIALRALARSACSQAQIERRLAKHGCPDDIIAQVIEELKARGWLDDARFAQDWVADRADRKRYGRRRLVEELKARGLTQDLLETTLPPLDPEAELQRARAAVARRWPPGSLAHLEGEALLAEKRRCAAFLARRGFDNTIIKKVLEELTSK
ncbi:regulatory protein RecX [Chthonomonas calidirosea]|uniref:Regulatory protein RecX n=1 Tax=Chthonomonas calidirosea (strain DSM 23976 / ICMP 18418 / T49) TaxID=1303518 RepID=S0EX16_CHTCT|nr:regulatory protein RecX [Chthonomonas calidirosea]CCW35950.1 Uncharacterized protein conserved in bacteria [Chthonomonas calidirosea T49]CEK17730.1 hypothetical protein CP488_01947 [Chthonomonas calidirosea]CEK18770.1 hypothetical protein CTKA_01951 [Chthonomonas calidirosea]